MLFYIIAVYFSAKIIKQTTLKVTDVLGNIIRNYELGITNGKTFTIDMSGESKGVYIVNVQTAKGVENRKVVVQ